MNLPPRRDIPSWWCARNEKKISLHLGECCFPPTPRVLDAIAEASRYANRYPDTNSLALREKLAAYVGNGVEPGNIIAGNGLDELIDLAVVSFTSRDAITATFAPTFFVYEFAARRHQKPFVALARADDFTLPASEALLDDTLVDRVALTFIANPNNPTGTVTPRDRLIDYLEHWPGIIVVDECYYECSRETVVDLVSEYPGLIVFRSMSKSFGLAGLRIGYAVAARSLVDTMERHAQVFPVNICAQAAGVAALEDAKIYRERIRELVTRRDGLKRALERLGLVVPPSSTNFLLSLWPGHWKDKDPASMLAGHGVLVSDQTGNVNAGYPALRIAIGTEEENDYLLDVLGELLGESEVNTR